MSETELSYTQYSALIKFALHFNDKLCTLNYTMTKELSAIDISKLSDVVYACCPAL